MNLRPATNTLTDMASLAAFCCELAASDGYQATINAEQLQQELFRPNTMVRGYFIEIEDKPVGFLIFFESFRVYGGERGLYIAGLYVQPEHRGQGFGKNALKFAANYALEHDFSYLNWLVEDNNTNAQSFYQSIGAILAPGWQYCKMDKQALKTLVKE